MTDAKVIVFAISCITALALVAFSNGIDGVLFTGAIGAIGGVVGFRIKVWKDKRSVAE